jgi:hypothetical protein
MIKVALVRRREDSRRSHCYKINPRARMIVMFVPGPVTLWADAEAARLSHQCDVLPVLSIAVQTNKLHCLIDAIAPAQAPGETQRVVTS